MTSEQRWERKIIYVHVPQLRHDSPIIQSPTMTSAPNNLGACHTWRFSGPTTDLLNQNLRLPKSSGDSLVYRHSRCTALEWNSLEQWFPITFVLSDGNCLNEIILGGNKKTPQKQSSSDGGRARGLSSQPLVAPPSPITSLQAVAPTSLGAARIPSACALTPTGLEDTGHHFVSEHHLSRAIIWVVKQH